MHTFNKKIDLKESLKKKIDSRIPVMIWKVERSDKKEWKPAKYENNLSAPSEEHVKSPQSKYIKHLPKDQAITNHLKPTKNLINSKPVTKYDKINMDSNDLMERLDKQFYKYEFGNISNVYSTPKHLKEHLVNSFVEATTPHHNNSLNKSPRYQPKSKKYISNSKPNNQQNKAKKLYLQSNNYQFDNFEFSNQANSNNSKSTMNMSTISLTSRDHKLNREPFRQAALLLANRRQENKIVNSNEYDKLDISNRDSQDITEIVKDIKEDIKEGEFENLDEILQVVEEEKLKKIMEYKSTSFQKSRDRLMPQKKSAEFEEFKKEMRNKQKEQDKEKKDKMNQSQTKDLNSNLDLYQNYRRQKRDSQ